MLKLKQCAFGALLAGMLFGNLHAQAVGSSGPELPIVDGTPTVDSITIVDSLSIVDVKVAVDISHTFRGDLQIDVRSPSMTTVRMSNNHGGGGDDVIVTFSSTGVPFDQAQLAAGLAFEMQPSGPGSMLDFAGQSSLGDWVLEINDTAGVDDGTLHSWQLELYDATSGIVTTPISGLSCSPQQTQATLTWNSGATYDLIEITVDGVVVQTLPGGETSAVVTGLNEWSSYEICVAASNVGEVALPICCTVDTPGDASGDHLVIAGEVRPGIDSVTALRNALPVATVVLPNFDQLVGTPASVWCCLGTFPSNWVLSPADGQSLKALILAGVPVYVSGADVWGFDDPTAFNTVDGVHADIEDGIDSHFAMIGEDFLVGFDAAYTDESIVSDFIDELVIAESGEDELGDDSRVILRDDTDPFNTAIAYYTNSGGRVVCCSTEFGGYDGDQTALAEALFSFLTQSTFRRGDANADGSFDISDPVFTLASLFTIGAPAASCSDAADSNDDALLNIADAVYSLAALFTSGAPVPPLPGATNCSADPTEDALDCALYDGCF